ncbi:MAG: TIGR02147 family protein [Fibrobacteria bacterium]
MQTNAPRIFSFTDFRQFLEEYYRVEKARNPKFSHRYIQEAIGTSSSGWFADLVKGRISLTGTYLMRLVALLKLGRTESEYFEAMVQYAQAASLEDKNRFLERMTSFKEFKSDVVGKDKFDYYSKWYHAAIRELLFIHEYRGDFRALAKALNPSIRPQQAKEAIALLERLDLVRPDASGRMLPSSPVLTKDPSIKSLHLAAFLKANMQLGMEALDRFDREERDISSLSLVLSAEAFQKAKGEIKSLRKKLLSLSEKPKPDDKVFQCNFQVFPISK